MELIAVVDDWLSRAESNNSKKSYRSALENFSDMVFNKPDLSHMTEDDWKGLVPSDVRSKFIDVLKSRGMRNSTAKYYIRVVRSFVSHMERYKEFSSIDTAYIKISCLETKNISDDTVSRAKLGANEFYEFVEWLQEERFTDKNAELGYKYAIVAEFMFKTAARLTATFKHLKWSDIRWESDSYHNYGWTAYVLDKGNKLNDKVIPESLYNKMYEMFFDGDLNGVVFESVSSQMFSRLTKEFGRLNNKEYTPHSLKVGAGTEYYNRTKDLVRTMEFLDHNDPKTTLKYIRLEDDRTQKGGYVLSLDVNKDELENLSKDQLLSIIKSDNALSMAIAKEAQKRCYAEGLMIEE